MKNIINGLNNVFLDETSDYKFEDLYETDFITELLTSLSQIMKGEFNEYIIFILSSHNPKIFPSSASYKSKEKKIIIFLSDESGTVPEYLSPYYYAIFKTYMQADITLVSNIFNFPLGCVKNVPQLPVIPVNSREYSVFFIGNLNNSRSKFYFSLISTLMPLSLPDLNGSSNLKKLLLRLKSNFDNRFPRSYIRFTYGFMQGITPLEYGQKIANSKIVLCPKGFYSSECFRHYEAMRAGCVIVSEKLPNNHFYKDSPIIQIHNWKEGFRKVTELLDNSSELEKLSCITQTWWNEKCSELATAHYIYSCICLLQDRKL